MTAHWAIALHGGAGPIDVQAMPVDRQAACRAALSRALDLGVERLTAGAAAVDVVEAVVRCMEDEPLFNAGRGSVLHAAGEVEMDASIMDGATGNGGGVGAVRTVRHAVSLARAVMEQTPHLLLVGAGAEALAAEVGLEFRPASWFVTPEREAQWQKAKAAGAVTLDHGVDPAGDPASDKDTTGGTIGAVARDRAGRLAAATSTGGMTNKRVGRVGDSAILGAGTWADRQCAVSCTGRGERFLQHGIARGVGTLMELSGLDLPDAAASALARLNEGDGGLIAVDAAGRIAMPFNTTGMYRAAADAAGRRTVALD